MPIVVARQTRELSGKTITRHYYWCPGCDSLYGIAINPDKQDNGAGWTFTGTLDCPTYSPSQLTTWEHGEKRKPFRCHTFIRDGKIQFLDDCTHDLKGKTVPLPSLPDWFVKTLDAG